MLRGYSIYSSEEEILKYQKNKNTEMIIRSYINLTLKIAYSYIRDNPNNKDEIISTALFGLITAVNNFNDEGKIITSYIISYVRGSILKILKKDRFITNFNFDSKGFKYKIKIEENMSTLLKKLMLTKLERKIVKCRLKKLSSTEICNRLGITKLKYDKYMLLIMKKGEMLK